MPLLLTPSRHPYRLLPPPPSTSSIRPIHPYPWFELRLTSLGGVASFWKDLLRSFPPFQLSNGFQTTSRLRLLQIYTSEKGPSSHKQAPPPHPGLHGDPWVVTLLNCPRPLQTIRGRSSSYLANPLYPDLLNIHGRIHQAVTLSLLVTTLPQPVIPRVCAREGVLGHKRLGICVLIFTLWKALGIYLPLASPYPPCFASSTAHPILLLTLSNPSLPPLFSLSLNLEPGSRAEPLYCFPRRCSRVDTEHPSTTYQPGLSRLTSLAGP